MYTVLNTFSGHANFYLSKTITSYTFLLDFKIVESLQHILKGKHSAYKELHSLAVLKNKLLTEAYLAMVTEKPCPVLE